MTTVITPTEEEWVVIEKFLTLIRQSDAGNQGAIIIAPSVQKRLLELGGQSPIGNLPGYDFGGEPDYSIDVCDPGEELAAFLADTTPSEFVKALEDFDLDIKLEGAAIAYGFRPSWAPVV
jgi:hypothetical protein